MTTIAYKNGELAADSLVTSGNQRVGFARKIGKAGRVLYGASGNSTWMHAFNDWVRHGCKGGPPKEEGEDVGEGLIIVDDSIVSVWPDGTLSAVKAPFYALGSGRQFARGAMACGASASEAVSAAIKNDCGSGGAVVVYRR